MKGRWFKSLFSRFALFSALTIAGVGIFQTAFAAQGFRHLVRKLDQQVYWGLASDFANILQPFTAQTIATKGLQRTFRLLKQSNPKVQIYLLNSDGEVLPYLHAASELLAGKKIDLEPIRIARSVENPRLPLLADNPTERPKKKSIFSVAPIRIEGESGFLYVVLESDSYGRLLRGVGQFFVVRTILVGIVLISIVGLLFGFLVYKYLTRSFAELTNAVGSYRSGDYDVRVPERREDEIGVLSRGINSMAEEIRTKTRRLEETDEKRRELVANISHDLKNPMAAITATLQTFRLHYEDLNKEKRDEIVLMLEDSVARQGKQLQDLFELSRLEAKDRTPIMEEVDIGELVQDVALEFRALAEEKSIQYSIDTPLKPGKARVDAIMIERVLSNVITNALHYTQAGGFVKVSATVTENIVTVSVEDSGVGIKGENLEKIFEPHFREDAMRSSKSGNAGLGLAIVKRILELHGSSIQVNSVEGKGSTFTFAIALNEEGD